MPKRGRASLVRQVQEVYDSLLKIGGDKHADKALGTMHLWIYSWETYKTYLKHSIYFATYAKETHGCRTLEEARPYAAEWIRSRIDKGLSPYTIKTEVSALAKLFGCHGKDFGVETPSRSRCSITRSRGAKPGDIHFSEERHKDLVDFCRGTGLRRRELKYLTGDKLIENEDGTYSILVDVAAKGGRTRIAPVIGPHADEIAGRMKAAGSARVWRAVPSHADIHSYRSDYATALYSAHARPREICREECFYNREHYNGKGIPKGGNDRDSIYRFKGERRGEWLDKAAMLLVSRALGHNRISVVGAHYIR